MARKSRVNLETKTDIVVQRAERIPTAIYARLSVENSGKSEDKNVIRNQIEICESYVAEYPDFDLVDTYIENGKTGTTFDRPQFNRLMEDIKTGKIKCLVVRDLSRFGRDYIETGTYLERIFPNIGLRFISVKERYDSFTVDTTNEALMIPLQNMINGLYSKDISRKVSTALKAKIEDGSFVHRNLAYGYMWNEDKTKVIIDEEVAPIVKDIFRWKIEGVSSKQIVQRLRDMDAPTCEVRKYQNGVREGELPKKVLWGDSTIFNMLTNPFYIGNTAYGKSVKALYKGIKGQKVKDKSQWTIYENTHEALISHEDFNVVQAIMENAAQELSEKKKASEKQRAKLIDLFEGKIFCADCKKRLYFRRHKMDRRQCRVQTEAWYAVYICSTYTSNKLPKCTTHNIQRKHLEEKVLSAIQTQVKVALDYEKLILMLKNTESEKSVRDKQNALISSLNLKLNGVQNKRTRLYEDFIEGILTDEEYNFAKQKYNDDYTRLNIQLEDAISRKAKFNEALSSDNKWIQLMKSVSKAKKLSQALVDETVEKVYVHENGDIELEMKYADVYVLTKACVEEIKSEVVA